MKYNTITKQVSDAVPGGVYEGVDYHGAPPDDVAARSGWVDVTPEIQAQIDADNAAAAAAQAAAKRQAQIDALTPLMMPASLYRATLRKYFGDGAETNRAVTREAVAGYFEQKRMAETITAQETADALSLVLGFETLSPIVGATPPNTWDLPWEVVP